MKYLLYLFFLLYLSACQTEPRLVLVKGEKVQAEIVLDTSADSLSHKAANLLRDYLFKMNDHSLQINSSPTENLHHIYIGRHHLSSEDRARLERTKYDDSFLIWTQNGDLYLSGKNSHGDIYAVCVLLEDYLGCMKFTPEEEFIPKKSMIALPEIQRLYSPAFPFRVPHFPGRYNRAFREWHRISSFDD